MPPLVPLLRYQAPSNVFRVIAAPDRPRLALELRDAARRETAFSVLALDQATVLADGLGLDEPWHCGLAGIAGEYLYLHYLAAQGFPDPKGLVAVHIPTQSIAWEQPELYYLAADAQQVQAYRLAGDARAFCTLESPSGQLVPSAGPPAAPVAAPLQWPTEYAPESPYYASFAQAAARYWGHSIAGPVAYLPHEHSVLLHYHVQGNDGTSAYLAALAHSGEVRLHLPLAKGLKGWLAEGFLVWGPYLVALQQNQTLLAFDLRQYTEN